MGCVCGLAVWLIKYILFFANVLFVLSGIALIVLGALATGHFVEYDELLLGQFSAVAITIIVVGSIVLVIAFCGCCGAITENQCLLTTYGVLLLVIFLAQVGVGIWALVSPNAIELFQKTQMKNLFEKEYVGPTSTSDLFDLIQSDLHCCGVDGPADYLPVFLSMNVPQSCCDDDFTRTCTSIFSYKTGCYDQLISYIDDSITVIGIVCIAAGVFEVLAMLFAFCLAGHYKNKSNSKV